MLQRVLSFASFSFFTIFFFISDLFITYISKLQSQYRNNDSRIITEMHESKQSLSGIHESIYQSQTHHLSIPSNYLKNKNQPLKETGQTYQKQNSQNKINQQPSNANFLMDSQQSKPFIHFYEQNIQLKKQQDQMVRQIAQLKNRINEANKSRRQIEENQLKMLAAGKKSAWDNNKTAQGFSQKRGMSARGKTRGGISQTHNARKIDDLLDIIEHYKKKMMTAEEQIKNLNRKNHLLEQDLKIKDKRSDQQVKNFNESSMKPYHMQQDLKQQLSKKSRQFEIEKQRNKYLESEIKRFQTKTKNLSLSVQQFEQLKLQNRNLEQKILRLTQLPSFNNITSKVDEERKYKELESKYKLLNQKFNTARNQKIKHEASVKLLQDQLIEVNREADLLDKQNQKLKAESIDDPILAKLSKNTNLLSKVYYEFQQAQNQKKTGNTSNIDDKNYRKLYEKVLLQKQALANQITTLRSKIDAMQQNWRQRERMNKIQKQQLATLYKDQATNSLQNPNSANINKVMSKNGVSYSDDVSMFSQDTNTKNTSNNTNYFDLFLGDLHLLETMLKAAFNIHSVENSLLLATVDFYNHDTQNTRPVHGGHCNLQSEFSFKIQEDQFFFKYLKKGSFYIDIWGLEGNKRHHFGRITIQLKPLIMKSHKNIAPVVSSSAPIYLNQKVMGSINLAMRLRLPIYEQLQKISEIGQMISSQQQAQSRRLVIHIEQGRGFAESSNTFIYYPFRLQDHYTKTFRGSNPAWNHHKTIQLKYNTDLKNYLRKNQLELIVFDDNAVITNQDGSDLVGNAYVSLLPLLENKVIKERVQVMKGAHRSGHIDIKIYWHDTEKQQETEGKSKVSQETGLQQKINHYLKNNRLEPEDIFNSIDKNGTGMINFEQFMAWVIKIAPGTPMAETNKVYSTFRQPVNLINWITKLKQLKISEEKDIAAQLSRINQEVFKHTSEIHKKQTLQQFLKDKDIVDIGLAIDKSGDGRISKQQLLKYFDEHSIDADQDFGDQNQIQIVTFLKRYQKYT